MVATRRSLTLIAVAGALGAVPAAAGAAAATTTLHASLSGKAEVPKAGTGTGSATVTLKPGTGRVCFDITLKNVGTAQMGHIHKGGASTAGPVSITLFTSPTKHPKGCVSAPKAAIRAVAKHPGRYYVNVHTSAYPAGAARGQLHH
jgi:hypothetical protein